MESQAIEKLHVILCGPLPQTECALIQRGDVEIHRDADNLNLLIHINHNDCDMIIVEAPYGHGLYSMTYPVRNGKNCPVWMVADPPNSTVWKEINLQLSNMQANKKKSAERAARLEPPKHEILILTDDPQMRSNLTEWMRDIYAMWDMVLPQMTAPQDVKAYLRELHERHEQGAPPELVVVAMSNVDGLNTAEHIRKIYPKTGLVWCCDLDFSLQSYHLHADYFFLLNEASREMLGTGLNRWQIRVTQHKDRGKKV